MIRESLQRLRLVAKSVANMELDVCDVLQAGHLRLEMLFVQVRATRDKHRREQIFEKIKSELETHSLVEEEIFYPECETLEVLKPLVLEAREAHRQFKALLREIEALARSSDRFEPKFRLLMGEFEHHARTEERKIFPKVRRGFSPDRLVELAARVRAAKRQKRAAA